MLSKYSLRGCVCTTGKLAFCLALYSTGVHLRDELPHVGHVGKQEMECWPIKTWEIAGVRL